MVSHGNDWTVFLTRPISAIVLLASAGLAAWPLVQAARGRRRPASGAGA